jgi:hypothetical protein
MLMSKETADKIAREGHSAFELAVERLHLTGAQVAIIMGVSHPTVNNWKKSPPTDFRSVTNILRATRKLAEIPAPMVATFVGRKNADHRLKAVQSWLEK